MMDEELDWDDIIRNYGYYPENNEVNATHSRIAIPDCLDFDYHEIYD